MMKAARLIAAETFQMTTENVPNIKRNEVLIRVMYCGICGSDLHAYKRAKGYEFVAPNVILGHEFIGVVIKVGNTKNDPLLGKHVVIESQHYCTECSYCRQGNFTRCLNRQVIGLHYDGGMADYAAVPIQNVIVLEQEMTIVHALAEPMSVGVHALKQLGEELQQKRVLVQGPGIIGLLVGLLCKEKGADVWVSGLQADYEHRLKPLEQLGLATYIQGQPVPFENVDIIMECSGSAAAIFSNADYLVKGGTILLVALYEHISEVYFTPIIRNEWTIKTSYGSNPQDYKEGLTWLHQYGEQLHTLLTIYELDDIQRAFQDALNKTILKGILKL